MCIMDTNTQKYMDTRAENKNTILFATLSQIFGDKMNLARIKFFGLFICALCKVQTVCIDKLAAGFDSKVKVDSSLRRIQRFMAEYLLDTDLIARFVFALLLHKPSLFSNHKKSLLSGYKSNSYNWL